MSNWESELKDSRLKRELFFKSIWETDIEKSVRIVKDAHRSGKISDELFQKAMKGIK